MKKLIESSQWLDENGIDLHIIDMNVLTNQRCDGQNILYHVERIR